MFNYLGLNLAYSPVFSNKHLMIGKFQYDIYLLIDLTDLLFTNDLTRILGLDFPKTR